MTVHHKLVRDLIPEIIRREGRRPVVEVLPVEQRRGALLAKLVEEAAEAADACDGDELAEELADVLEVVRALAAALGLSLADVTELADRKKVARGGFEHGLFLVEVV